MIIRVIREITNTNDYYYNVKDICQKEIGIKILYSLTKVCGEVIIQFIWQENGSKLFYAQADMQEKILLKWEHIMKLNCIKIAFHIRKNDFLVASKSYAIK